MAEVGSTTVSDDKLELSDVLSPSEGSLQELIETELGLRLPPKGDHTPSFTEDFLAAERKHTELLNGGSVAPEPPSPSPRSTPRSSPPPLSPRVLEMNRLNSLASPTNNHTQVTNNHQDTSWTTVEEVAKDMVDHAAIFTLDSSTTLLSTTTTIQVVTEKVLTTEEVVEEGAFEVATLVTETTTTSQVNGTEDSSSAPTSPVKQTEITESTAVEKKTKKKKSLTESGEVATAKTKKTKKTKKTEEKENHISVITNGHDSPKEALSPSIAAVSAVPEDDLSNVCVRDLKLTYVKEASKSCNSLSKPSEEPVLPAVPIRELRRSFGDIHKACETPELTLSEDKEKQLKSSFSKFDQLSKKSVLHVRSSDSAKAQKTFNQPGSGGEGQNTAACKACGKTVFAMEQIKAERAVWHKNCFRCHTCNKQLTVDIYSSHEGQLYCKPHFKELFKPKVVVEPEEEPTSDKPDLGLEELSSLNVKSRFQVFEKQDSTAESELERSSSAVNVKRSPSILSKLAKFQKKGMNVGVTDESLNGYVYEESSTSSEEQEDDDEEETGVVKCRKQVRERPMSFNKMDDVKKNWECGATRRDELREERKQEIQHIRSRLFMGKQGKMKELYEQAVAESEGRASKKEMDTEVIGEKARLVREKFEKGEPVHSDSEEEKNRKSISEDLSVFEEGISKKSRSLFLEMDAKNQTSAPAPAPSPPVKDQPIKKSREVYTTRQPSEDIVRASDTVEDVVIETADLSSKFKFFERYKEPEKERRAFRITPPREGQVKSDSPEREVYRDPDVVRCDEKVEDDQVVLKSQTTSRMLSMFRQLEEQKEILPDGPKPKKCFTPPPDYKGGSESEEEDSEEESEEEEEEEEEDSEEVIKASYKVKDEFLEQAKNAARAKALAAKFESWEPEKQSANNAITMLDSEQASIDSTKSLRAHFESLKAEQPKEKPKAKVNRFVEAPVTAAVMCALCETKVYPLEKVETNGKTFHKGCFRCTHCKCILRMDTYTLNNGHLYCLPHFKQLFIAKGNYDEGFGSDQHKRKWEVAVNGSSS